MIQDAAMLRRRHRSVIQLTGSQLAVFLDALYVAGHMPILGSEAEGACVVEEAFEVEGDGGAGFLCDFVFDGEIEVVGAVAEAFESALVLREHGSADARDVVEVNAGEREVAEVLLRGDLDAAELGEPGLVGPAEETRESAAD